MSIHLINEFINEGSLSEDDIHNITYHARKGDVDAQYHLALMYDTGNGLPRNPREAENWYRQAAAQKHAGAMYFLAKLYSTQNSGIRRDEAEAKRLFDEAAAKGYSNTNVAPAN